MKNQLLTSGPHHLAAGDRHAHPFRTTARIIGVIYLAGMVLGITGDRLIHSIMDAPDHLSTLAANSMLLSVGVVLWLVTVAGDASHGILMYPVLKRHSGRAAVGYLAARIMDATFIAVMALMILIQIPIGVEFAQGGSDASYLQALSAVLGQGQLYAYEIAMLTLGVSGLILCSALYRAALIPRPLAIWGLVGYAILLGGSVLQILGFQLNTLHAIPGGLWELFIGVWLIAKGFNPPVSDASTSSASVTPDLVGTATS
jgi:hypothetical protein